MREGSASQTAKPETRVIPLQFLQSCEVLALSAASLSGDHYGDDIDELLLPEEDESFPQLRTQHLKLQFAAIGKEQVTSNSVGTSRRAAPASGPLRILFGSEPIQLKISRERILSRCGAPVGWPAFLEDTFLRKLSGWLASVVHLREAFLSTPCITRTIRVEIKRRAHVPSPGECKGLLAAGVESEVTPVTWSRFTY